MFPIALLAATGSELLLRQAWRPLSVLAWGPLVALALFEIRSLQLSTFDVIESDMRVDAVVRAARERAKDVRNPVLFVIEGLEGTSFYKAHLDAMLAAQRLGWPTINGYSGNAPPGYSYQLTCDNPARQLSTYRDWHWRLQRGDDLDTDGLLRRTVFVGWPDCSAVPGHADRLAATLGAPPEAGRSGLVTVQPQVRDTTPSEIGVAVRIINADDQPLSIHAFAPLQLAWRWVPAGTQLDRDADWNTRAELPADVPAHGSLDVPLRITPPPGPGTWFVEFSMVSEWSFWFHDHGLAIARAAQPVSRP